MQQEEDLNHRYLTALAALERGDVERARLEFDVLLLDYPRFAPAWDGLARCHEAEGDLNRAGDSFRRAMRLDRQGWRSRYNWGAALHRAGETEKALRWLREAARLAPEERRPHQRLGQCLFDMGDYPGALAAFARALQAPERDVRDSELYVQMGSAEAARGDLEAADRAFERACLLAPDDPSVYYHWALLSEQAGDLDGADRLAVRARALAPRSLRHHLLLVRLALDHARPEAAAGRIDELAKLPDGAGLAQALRAELARRTGRVDEARALALSALQTEGLPSAQAVDAALDTLRRLHGLHGRWQGFRLVVEATCGDQSYFRPYVVLAGSDEQARRLVAEIQDSLEEAEWEVIETERFTHEGEALAGVYQVLLTRVLFPRDVAVSR